MSNSQDSFARLQVLIVTHGPQGLERVARMDLPEVDGVGYIVSCQSDSRPLPAALCRMDVTVSFTPTRGVGRNRNHALDLACAPYVLLADDDIILHRDGLRRLIELFDANPSLDVATLMCRRPDQGSYPPAGHDLRKRWKNYFPVNYEIALRLGSARRAGLRFCDIMGVGSPRFQSGEEDVLLLNAVRKGLCCRFFPILVCDHPSDTTGTRDARRPGVLQADGVNIALAYSLTILPRLMLKAWRVGGNVLKNFYYLSLGAAYALRHRGEFLL